jgi:hypothetical protein
MSDMMSSLPTSAGTHFKFGIAVLAGPSIDATLDEFAALAMALDASTILVSGRLAGLSAAARRLILCHELAHLVQLRRGGSDAEEALEAEAWEAAASALRGHTFQIRHGAGGPLFARAFVAMDGAIGDAAVAHYQRFAAERQIAAGAVQVTTVTRVSPVSLDSLLNAIIAAGPDGMDKSFVLAAHGNTEGLTMPVVGESKFKANTQTLRFLVQPNVLTQKLTAPHGVKAPSADEISALVGKMQTIQKLKFESVEFRGCAIGADMVNLEALRDFLACTSVSGLDVKSSFAQTRLNLLSAQQFDQWAKLPGVVVSQYPAGRFGIQVSWDAHQIIIGAENNAAVPFWLKEHFFKVPPFPPQPMFEGWMTSAAFHGLHTNPIAFPMDPAYAAHIKRVIFTASGLVRQ